MIDDDNDDDKSFSDDDNNDDIKPVDVSMKSDDDVIKPRVDKMKANAGVKENLSTAPSWIHKENLKSKVASL